MKLLPFTSTNRQWLFQFTLVIRSNSSIASRSLTLFKKRTKANTLSTRFSIVSVTRFKKDLSSHVVLLDVGNRSFGVLKFLIVFFYLTLKSSFFFFKSVNFFVSLVELASEVVYVIDSKPSSRLSQASSRSVLGFCDFLSNGTLFFYGTPRIATVPAISTMVQGTIKK